MAPIPIFMALQIGLALSKECLSSHQERLVHRVFVGHLEGQVKF